MLPPEKLPRRTSAEQVALALASCLLAFSVLTLAGWWLGSDELLQPFGLQDPLSLNAALGFLALALALAAMESGRPRLIAIAALGLLIGIATATQEATGQNFSIDQALALDHLQSHAHHPGRMPLVVAIGLILGGGVLVWRASGRGGQRRLVVEALVGSLLGSVGLAALLGYGADLPVVYHWGSDRSIGPIAAIALLLTGLHLILRAWGERSVATGGAPPWAPLPTLIGCVTLSGVLWLGLRDREEAFTAQGADTQLEQFAATSKDVLERQSGQFERLARVWADARADAPETWETDAVQQLARETGALGCLSIAVVDTAYRTVWSVLRDGTKPKGHFDHADFEQRRTALQQVELSSGRPVISASTRVIGPRGTEKGFVIYAPIPRPSRPASFVAAEFSYRAFFRQIATTKVRITDTYTIAVWVDGDLVFHDPPVIDRAANATPIERSYALADRQVRVQLAPLDGRAGQARRLLPEFALAAALGITVLLGLSVHLARTARAGQRAAELSNRKLFAENEERRRIEERLKVSDERLRLALDSTQIGIFEWSVAAGHVYYSPGLWAMLGYDHTGMPTTVAAWQSLIHPEDLTAYRRRTDAQLAGIANFIEPDYRVRSRNGDWRWVYTRAKAVATGADGRPARIIGTVQDITQRREAELALRESQAEARKLSLVAARTDSPVLIGSANGHIEWANEAFCRTMEYTLEEVIGKSPVHFMVGPESNQRTMAKIRSAMSRGQGISTEVINYSKSGRKYHMTIEIQPVRGASGEIEYFIAVQSDITARVETEQQLRRAKGEADDASRAKSEFLASMSHEIRTPMNGVIGMTSLLMETRLNEEQSDYVNTIRTSGESLLTIINDILDFSKIESGKMELENAPFDLAQCLEDALDLFAAQAGAKQVELGYHLHAEVPAQISGDATRLRQVIVNLVNNAVKFTPSGSISVEVRRITATPPPLTHPTATPGVIIEFAVRDTGIGVPPDRIDRLFRAFSQIDSSTTRKYGGTGLGLAICQRLCELMGGSIRAESVVDQGSTFTFTVRTEAAPPPLAGAPAVPARLRGGIVLGIEDNALTAARLGTLFEKWGVDCFILPNLEEARKKVAALPRPPALLVVDAGQFDGATAMAALAAIPCPRLFLYPIGPDTPVAPPEDQPFATASKPIRTATLQQAIADLFADAGRAPVAPRSTPRVLGEEIPLEILLAEDNTVNQKVAIRILERLGYRADAVANGLEAVTTLEYRCYDLVFMDLQMPEMDGSEATRQIRRRVPANRQPKIVALTANAMQGDRESCLAAGMNDYISKPVKLEEITEVIRRLFGKPGAPTSTDPAPLRGPTT